MFFGVDDIDIICSCLHDIFECSKFRSVLQYHIHSQKVRNIVLILSEFLSFFSRDPETASFVFLDIVDIVDAVKFEDRKVFEKSYIFDIQSAVFFSCIQHHIIQIQETLCIVCGRIYLYFASHSMCGSDHSDL